MAQLGAEARVGAQSRRSPAEDAEEVRELTAAGDRALQDRGAPLGSRELVVDLEPALLGLHRASLSASRLPAVSIGKKGVSAPKSNTQNGPGRIARSSRARRPSELRGGSRRARSRRQRPPGRGPAGTPRGRCGRAGRAGGSATPGRRRMAGVGRPVIVTVRRARWRAAARRSKRRGSRRGVLAGRSETVGLSVRAAGRSKPPGRARRPRSSLPLEEHRFATHVSCHRRAGRVHRLWSSSLSYRLRG